MWLVKLYKVYGVNTFFYNNELVCDRTRTIFTNHGKRNVHPLWKWLNKIILNIFFGGDNGNGFSCFCYSEQVSDSKLETCSRKCPFYYSITPTAKRYTKRGKFFPSMPQVIFCSHKKKKTHRGWVVAVQKKKLSSEFLIFVLFCDKTDVQINLLAPAID